MKFVLSWEAGYVNHPDDPGGETNFGISKRSYPDVDIANLTEEGAKAIYRRDYWDEVRGDDLSPPIALAVVGYAVHSGVKQSAKTLQKVVGAGRDGAIGPMTLAKVAEACAERGAKKVAQEVVMERAIFLTKLVKRDADLTSFLTGWMKRTHACMAEVSK